MMIDEIKSLPALPSSVTKIQELCGERDVNISKLIEVIEKDPMLSANILKSVNSPLYGMSKEPSYPSGANM
jgi:HD-like signal output (HDOD) protein